MRSRIKETFHLLTLSGIECVVHCTHLSKFSGLRSLTDDTIAAMMKAKAIRELVKGANHHEQQCQSFPEILDKDRLRVHTACYKKFTLINSDKKYLDTTSKTPIADSRRSSARLPQESRQKGSSILHQLSVLCE